MRILNTIDEEKDTEIKEHIEGMTLSDLEALFDNDTDKEEIIDTDLDFILDSLETNEENTLDDLGEIGSKSSNKDIEAKTMEPLKNEIELNLENDSPSDEDLLNIESNMDDLITEIENEDIDELEAIMNSEQSEINIDFSNDKEDDEVEPKETNQESEIELDISEDEILGNFDEESFDRDNDSIDEDDDESIKKPSYDSDDSSESGFSDDSDEPEFESFSEEDDESSDDDYGEGYDPRFPEY